uniref:Putative cyclin n=1 Tax=Trypanosoma vivax (strain Y486) TaxID=1055687 RepID=G0TXW0_TRYVY|nr:putative cyclin [Trypanosoma vivax Y486]
MANALAMSIDGQVVSSSDWTGLKALYLPVPRHLQHSKQQSPVQPPEEVSFIISNSLAPPVAPLSCMQLQKAMREVIFRLEVTYANDTEKFRKRLQAEFNRLLRCASDATQELIDFVPGQRSLSYCVLHILHLRRRVLCQGFGYGLQDLKEWLRLARALGEPLTPDLIREYARELGAFSRQAVEKVLKLHSCDDGTLLRALLDMPLPSDTLVAFHERYYNLTLDDLVAMGDERPTSLSIAAMQRDFSLRGQEKLVEWMLRVTVELRLQLETFFLSASILDRYLLKVPVSSDQHYLVAYSALLLASKHEEKCLFPVRDPVRFGGKTYPLEAVVAMVNHIFVTLKCNVVCATLSSVWMGFLWRQEPPACKRQCSFLMYLLATLSIRTHYRQHCISALAATAVYVSRICFDIPTGRPCPEVLALLPVVKGSLERNHRGNPNGVYEIFQRSDFHEASSVPLPQDL